jgi:hypothetical protein
MKTTITELPVYSETDQQPNGEQDAQRVEWNWIGPSVRQPTKSSFLLEINLVVLVTTIKSDTRAFLAYENQGIASKGVPACIPVYKYGDQVGDDETQLGILVRKDPVTEFMVGHQEQTNRIRQVSIMADYRMDL